MNNVETLLSHAINIIEKYVIIGSCSLASPNIGFYELINKEEINFLHRVYPALHNWMFQNHGCDYVYMEEMVENKKKFVIYTKYEFNKRYPQPIDWRAICESTEICSI